MLNQEYKLLQEAYFKVKNVQNESSMADLDLEIEEALEKIDEKLKSLENVAEMHSSQVGILKKKLLEQKRKLEEIRKAKEITKEHVGMIKSTSKWIANNFK